jgi:hypothetical protein
MKRLIFSLIAAGALASALPAQADDSWVFGRSYYSHDPITAVRIADPAVHGGPYYSRPQGAFVKSGFRNNNIIINAGRAGSDQTTVWESWVQTGVQF